MFIHTLLVLTAVATALAVVPTQELRKLKAYDCSRPTDRRAVALPDQENCHHDTDQVVDVKEETLLLLQRVQRQQITATRCRVHKAYLTTYCGTYDHQTVVPTWSHFNRELSVSAEECRQLWSTAKYEVKVSSLAGGGKKTFPLSLNGTTTFRHYPVGKTEVSTDHVTCTGERLDAINRLVQFATYTVELHQVPVLMSPGGELTNYLTQRLLPCTVGAGLCQVPGDGMYVWTPTTWAHLCPLFEARQFKGLRTTGATGKTVIMSTDGSMIRVLIKDQLSMCGQLVHPTNYDMLYISSALQASEFRRPLPEREFSLTTYVNQQDGFLFEKVKGMIHREHNSVLRNACEVATGSVSRQYLQAATRQRAALDGQTLALGNGYFATPAGEGFYRYKCREITVYAQDTAQCRDALPVQLQAKDLRQYLQGHPPATSETETATPQFYIEPHSRRITTTATLIPCVDEMAPLYRDESGGWLSASPRVRMVPAPTTVESSRPDPELADEELDFEQGGIYSPEAVRRMEVFVQLPRVVKDVTTNLARQSDPNHGEFLHPHDVFPEVPDLEYDFLAQFWVGIDRYGRIASILIGSVMLVKFLCWIAGLFLRFLTLWRHHGFGWQLLGVVLPSILHWLHLRPNSKASDHLPLQEMAVESAEDRALHHAPYNALAIQVADLQSALELLQQEREEPRPLPQAPPLPKLTS